MLLSTNEWRPDVLFYIAGYIVKKINKSSDCPECVVALYEDCNMANEHAYTCSSWKNSSWKLAIYFKGNKHKNNDVGSTRNENEHISIITGTFASNSYLFTLLLDSESEGEFQYPDLTENADIEPFMFEPLPNSPATQDSSSSSNESEGEDINIESKGNIKWFFRHIAYRQFARWIWHKLGKGVGVVIPSCVVKQSRSEYPSVSYEGFRDSQIRPVVEGDVKIRDKWYVNSTPGGGYIDVDFKLKTTRRTAFAQTKPGFVDFVVETNVVVTALPTHLDELDNRIGIYNAMMAKVIREKNGIFLPSGTALEKHYPASVVIQR
eukprot:gene2247-2567_t